MILGDVFSVVVGILGGFLTLWAAVVAAGLLFPIAASRAAEKLKDSRGTFFTGLLVLIGVGIPLIALSSAPAPLLKGAGLVGIMALLSVAILGTAGVAERVGTRIRELDPSIALYPATVRGAAFVVGGALMPLLGWFFFSPVLFLMSLGAGWRALVRRRVRALVEAA